MWPLIALGIVVLFIVSSFLHLEHKFHIIKTLLLFVLLLLFIGSIYAWFSSEKTSLDSPKNIVNSVYLYVGWLGETGAKLFSVGKDSFGLIGNVIKGNQTKTVISDGRK